jgi:cysteine desulfurase
MRSATRIYLDAAATTAPLPAVVAGMARASSELIGNPSSSHGFGPPAQRALEDAREFLRGTLGAHRVVFTSGGSEADCLGIVGSAMARPPGRVLMSRSDHPALLQCAGLLGRLRHHTTVLPVTAHGDVAPEVLFDELGQDVRVVALMYGHNELGTLCRLEESVELVRRVAPTAHVHVDLVQTYGKLAFDFDRFDVDSVAVSGHKFHGPRGAGFLALSSTAELAPLLPAGGQEGGLRGGTENVAGAVGLAIAAEHVLSMRAHTAGHTDAMLAQLFDRLQRAVPGAERLGLAFSIGAACHGHEPAPKDKAASNPVLAAIGLDAAAAREVVRLSASGMTSSEDADAAAAILVDEATRLLQSAPRGRSREYGAGVEHQDVPERSGSGARPA